MLNKSGIFAAPDNTIEVWCLLEVEYSDGGDCVGWNVGFGNINQLVRKESRSLSAVDCEGSLLKELMEEHLHPCRNKEGRTTLITSSASTLPRLRTRLLAHGCDTSFRGLNHLCLETVIEDYFHQPESSASAHFDADMWITDNLRAVDDDQPVKELWRRVKQIGPLVPRQAMIGTRL